MKKPLVITLNVLTWTAIFVYMIVVSRYSGRCRSERTCRSVEVRVLDSAERNFISPAMVRAWFETERIPLVGQELSSINTLELEALVRRRGFVKTARVYTSLDGRLHVELTQRKPVMRMSSVEGYDFYVTEDDCILPLQRQCVAYVPVVTGRFRPPFRRGYVGPLDSLAGNEEKKVDKNYSFLVKLINFVKFVDNDAFWKAFVVQINVDDGGSDSAEGPSVEIVPRAGNQIVRLGSLDGYREKLDKLLSFYRNGAAYEGWDRYRYIDLDYKDQIVCIK
ncbi:hypothetical protein [uncultured Alistipes sp.]|uniref:cell division protein FtsQ/DivIB n=1 Tax=uncultured Alistipes sp. TaxID=538949 RepID=UPI0026139978|nr:hypothetical protein [uncultured Alistipes sp.]